MPAGARAGPPARLVVVAVLGVLLAVAPVVTAQSVAAQSVAAQTGADPAPDYRNPVSEGFADTFADPAVIRGRDGYWYAYGTTDPLREGRRPRHLLPVARSPDLRRWTYVGDVFTEQARPRWTPEQSSYWAPDVRYVDGRYHLYYTATDTLFSPARSDSAIGVATAPSPAGPWTDAGGPVVGPRSGGGGTFLATLDPAVFTDLDGARYLYYGSYRGGIWVGRLSRDGTRLVGPARRVASDDRYEAPFVVRRGEHYYLFVSAGSCCAGPTSGYSVFVGRSTSVWGPFADREGEPLDQPRVGGSVVLTPNGNRWIGTGHTTVVPDLAGQDWLLYHAIDRADPFLDEPFVINERPMLLDRLDWVDGWPVTRAGLGSSAEAVRGPTTTPLVGNGFEDPSGLDGWEQVRGSWTVVADPGSGTRHARRVDDSCAPGFLVSPDVVPTGVRVEAALRLDAQSAGATGLTAGWRAPSDNITAWVDGQRDELVVEVLVAGRLRREARQSLPGAPRAGWHRVSLETRPDGVTARLEESGLHDPVAEATVVLPPGVDGAGAVAVASRCAGSDADDVSAAPLPGPPPAPPVEPDRGPVDPEHSDEFDAPGLDERWRWLRAPAAEPVAGELRWPTQVGDLVGSGNNGSVLLRDMPAGAYTVRTRLTVDLGEWAGRDFQQAGLIAHVGDDLFVRLTQVAIRDTRQVEFGKEMPFAGRTSFGPMPLGPPQPTVWLELAHVLDPESGEHEFRAALSHDGQRWLPGGVWTLPAEVTPRVGLVSHGAAPGALPATARFDFFRVHRPPMTGGSPGSAWRPRPG